MRIRGGRGFIGEVLWRPVTGVWTLLTGLASILAWLGVGEFWADGIKVFMVVVILLLSLLIYIIHACHRLYKKIDQPLCVRKVQRSTPYFKNNVMIVLDRSDTVHIGDILTLFVREGEAEVPVCLLSVESTTSRNFPQSVVFGSITDDLPAYLLDESRLEQLQAKRGVTRRHLEWLITQ